MTPIDMASSYTHNVVFTHWSASMVPRARAPAADATAGAGAAGGAEDGQGRVMPIQQECIEVGGKGCWATGRLRLLLCRRTIRGSNRSGTERRMHGLYAVAQALWSRTRTSIACS